jgi:mannosyltransferase OCH1-like enzyme
MDSDESLRSSIPKITHRIWFQGWDKVPEKYQENVRLLEEMNSEFEHKKWDEQSLRRECELLGKPYAEKFDSIPLMIMKVDYGRYIVLYRYGGISIDMDMKPIRPLQETPGLDTEEMIVSKLPNPVGYTGYLNNAMFAVKPRSPIIKEMIDKCTTSTKKQEDYLNKELYLNNETGPEFVNKCLEKYKKRIKILDSEYFEPCYSSDMLCKPSKSTILDHRHSMSWIDSGYHWIFKLLFLIYRFLPIVLIILFVWITIYKPSILPTWVIKLTGRRT